MVVYLFVRKPHQTFVRQTRQQLPSGCQRFLQSAAFVSLLDEPLVHLFSKTQQLPVGLRQAFFTDDA